LRWDRRFPAAVGDLSVPTPTAAENANGQRKKYPGIRASLTNGFPDELLLTVLDTPETLSNF